MNFARTILVALALCIAHGGVANAADDSIANALLEGVNQISRPGVPGPVHATTDDGSAIVLARMAGGHMPVVSAAAFGRGWVVAFGHGGYLSAGALNQHDTGTLLRNAIIWTARNESPVVTVVGPENVASFIREQFEFTTRRGDGNDWAATLEGTDVLVTRSVPTTPEDQQRMRRFIQHGGGVITAQLGWGWQQLNPEKELHRDFPPNQLFAPLGIVWADGYIDGVVPAQQALEDGSLELASAATALQRLQDANDLSDAESKQVASLLTNLLHALPHDDRRILPLIERLIRERGGDERVISTRQPITPKTPIDRLAVVHRHRERANLPVHRIAADPSAAAFPGAVPDDADRVREEVTIDLSTPGWHSLGLYVPPGETVHITAPGDTSTIGLVAQVGVHTDRLWNKETWRRHPDIVRRFPLTESHTALRSPFGGLLIIDVPGNAGDDEVTLRITGAVRSPLFVLGETSLDEWRDEIRHAPGPWAELATDRIILTTTSEAVRDLDDPVTLLEKWNTAMSFYEELSQRPLPKRPERMVCDEQIVAGYMHAGYPIMMHLDQTDKLVDIDNLNNAWGFWHELGHNFQHRDWTFGGTVEVTCNLFTLYIIEQFTGTPAAQHDRFVRQQPTIVRHLAEGADFNQWKSKPFLALGMYVQLQEAFGWEAFKKVFATYRDLPQAERPQNDQEKRDQWMVRFSRTVGRDLGPFFQAWGVPTTASARESIADLPEWFPANWSELTGPSAD